MSKIPKITIPTPIIERIPGPQIRDIEPPIIRGISIPVINLPDPTIDYPTIDVPTQQEFEQQLAQPQLPSDQQQETNEEEDTRDLKEDTPAPPTPTPPIPVTPSVPAPQPTITIGGIEAPLPEPAPLITAGATAMVTTSVTLTATILVSKFKDVLLEPMMKRLEANIGKPKKVKIKKQVKPVLHYVMNDHNTIDILEYSQKGTKVIGQTDDVERYIRDQVENDSLYELDNKIIIDDVIKEKFTKEGAKRFKSLFAPAKTIAKKLGSKFSI